MSIGCYLLMNTTKFVPWISYNLDVLTQFLTENELKTQQLQRYVYNTIIDAIKKWKRESFLFGCSWWYKKDSINPSRYLDLLYLLLVSPTDNSVLYTHESFLFELSWKIDQTSCIQENETQKLLSSYVLKLL